MGYLTAKEFRKMNKLAAFFTALLWALPVLAANPVVTVSEVTQTSGTLTWTAVPGVTEYRIDQLQSSGYGQTFVPIAEIEGTQFHVTGMYPGESRVYKVYSNEGVPFDTNATQVILNTFAPPHFTYWTCAKPTRVLKALPYTQFYPGYTYKCTANFSGNPKPVFKLVSGPAGMTQSLNTLTWAGNGGPTPVTVRLTNIEGQIDFTYILSPK